MNDDRHPHDDTAVNDIDLSRFVIPEGEHRPVHALIARRRRQILVHSYLYYRLDRPVINDATFDQWARELAELQRVYPNEAAETVYHDAFIGFDGSTGFNLPLDDAWVRATALQRDADRAGTGPVPLSELPDNAGGDG